MKCLFSKPVHLRQKRGYLHQQYRRFKFDGIRDALQVNYCV